MEEIDGQPYLRLMRPLITETGCLKCHAQQGYEEEDIRGGISVSVPMSLLFSIYRKDVFLFSLAHGILLALGLIGIFLGSCRIRQSMLEREQAEAKTRSVIENMLDGLITMDNKGNIESLNSASCKMFGYDPAEIVGQNIEGLIGMWAQAGIPDKWELVAALVNRFLVFSDTGAGETAGNNTASFSGGTDSRSHSHSASGWRVASNQICSGCGHTGSVSHSHGFSRSGQSYLPERYHIKFIRYVG